MSSHMVLRCQLGLNHDSIHAVPRPSPSWSSTIIKTHPSLLSVTAAETRGLLLAGLHQPHPPYPSKEHPPHSPPLSPSSACTKPSLHALETTGYYFPPIFSTTRWQSGQQRDWDTLLSPIMDSLHALDTTSHYVPPILSMTRWQSGQQRDTDTLLSPIVE